MITAREFAIKAHGDQKYGDEPLVDSLWLEMEQILSGGK